VPWIELSGAAIISLGNYLDMAMFLILKKSVLVANVLANFSVLVTYENFVALGLLAAIPASAGRYFNSQSVFILIRVILNRAGYSPVW
jgi:hypothetical protein